MNGYKAAASLFNTGGQFSRTERAILSVIEPSDLIEKDRSRAERRSFSWKTVLLGFFRSRRRDSRRSGESEPLFTDYHHPWLFFLAVGIMLMSCMDAFFTLQLLDRGAIEINPIMAAVIGQSALAFAATKMLLTAFGILALVYLSKSRFMNRLRTGILLTVFFSGYAVLICYEFVFLIRQL